MRKMSLVVDLREIWQFCEVSYSTVDYRRVEFALTIMQTECRNDWGSQAHAVMIKHCDVRS